MGYDVDMLEEIDSSVDLLEYVGKDIPMKQRGKEWFGHCPLHVDKTASFSITPGVNKFFCFGCGRGGKIINYLKEYEKLSYSEAVKKAAKLAQIDLSKMCRSSTVQYNKMLKRSRTREKKLEHPLLDKKRDYEEKYLKESIPEWEEEGIDPSVIELFEIRSDNMANRIVYPVYDSNGRFINVKGRTRYKEYKELGIAKYINYNPVGTMDYFQGANITSRFIAETKEIKIFESIKSVMKLYSHGMKDSVSAEKHTLTSEQIRLLVGNRDISDIVLCYDSDIDYFSEKAVRSNIDSLKRFFNVYVIEDRDRLLGGKKAKNSPIDLGIDVWNELYAKRRKVI